MNLLRVWRVPAATSRALRYSSELASKRLEILREIAPSVRRLAIMGNVSSPLIPEMREAQSTALRLGLEVGLLEIRQADDIPLAFKTALNDRADAVYVCVIRLQAQTDFELSAWRRRRAY